MMKVLDEAHGKAWSLYHGDCVQAIAGIPDASVDLCIHSPPFASLFVYSESIADMGNCENDQSFMEHYRYLIPELFRVTRPGRLCVVHAKDLVASLAHNGFMGLRDFPGEIIRAFVESGWTFHSRVTIWKDPVVEMQRTKNHGLLYKELVKDSCGSRQGTPDYLMVFRKVDRGGALVPVTAGAERFDRYVGMEPPDCDADIWTSDKSAPGGYRRPQGYRTIARRDDRWPTFNPFEPGTEAYRAWSIAVWQRYASSVWMDIDQTDTLNYRIAKADADSKHMCPLQLQVVERAVHLWTNPGDVVFSPFAGVSSELYGAVRCGRRGLGVELKAEYFNVGCGFLGQLESDMAQPTLFDAVPELATA